MRADEGHKLGRQSVYERVLSADGAGCGGGGPPSEARTSTRWAMRVDEWHKRQSVYERVSSQHMERDVEAEGVFQERD